GRRGAVEWHIPAQLAGDGADVPGVVVEAQIGAERGGELGDGPAQTHGQGAAVAQRRMRLLRLEEPAREAHAAIRVRLKAAEVLVAAAERADERVRQRLGERRLDR